MTLRPRQFILLCGLAVAGCGSESSYELSSATMDCRTNSCLVTFMVANTSDRSLSLDYQVSLHRNDETEPEDAREVVVGTAGGAIALWRDESRQIQINVDVSGSPSGSRVSVHTARTPALIRKILEP